MFSDLQAIIYNAPLYHAMPVRDDYRAYIVNGYDVTFRRKR